MVERGLGAPEANLTMYIGISRITTAFDSRVKSQQRVPRGDSDGICLRGEGRLNATTAGTRNKLPPKAT